MPKYPVGAFFVTPVGGWIGFLIALGQLLAGTPSRYCHAGVIVTATGDTLEAQPGGARPGHISDYPEALICDGPILLEVARRAALGEDAGVVEAGLRARVPVVAAPLIGTPYSVLDYFALAAVRLHLPSARLRAYVASTGHEICSALVDLFFQRLGIHLWTDPRRLPGDVTPAQLAAWAEDWEEHRDPAAA